MEISHASNVSNYHFNVCTICHWMDLTFLLNSLLRGNGGFFSFVAIITHALNFCLPPHPSCLMWETEALMTVPLPTAPASGQSSEPRHCSWLFLVGSLPLRYGMTQDRTMSTEPLAHWTLGDGGCGCYYLPLPPPLLQPPVAPARMNPFQLPEYHPPSPQNPRTTFLYTAHSRKTLHCVFTGANSCPPRSSVYAPVIPLDSLFGLVAPLWEGVPQPIVSTSIWALATLYFPVYFSLSSAWLKAPPGQSCHFSPKHSVQGLKHSRYSRWRLPEWSFAMSLIFKNVMLVVM